MFFLEENHNRDLEGLTFHEGTRPTPGSEAGKMAYWRLNERISMKKVNEFFCFYRG